MPKKLKRFLLRYEPPGLGFEVSQDDGCIEIVHKDLPAATHVTSQEEILVQVDRLIAEDDLLTRKRHRPALVQLLARLYQVEVESDIEEDTGDSPIPSKGGTRPVAKAAGSTNNDATSVLTEDKTVVLIGLKGEQAVHNGELGTLTKCRHEKKKYEVQMSASGAEIKVKGVEHLVLVQPKFTPLAVGMAVVIRGLRNHTELNGCLGRVVECHEETHRFEVRATESGQLFRVKQENLVPIDIASLPLGKDISSPTTPRKEKAVAGGALPESSSPGGEDNGDVFEAGSQVELQGLKTAMAYNGQAAEVLSVDRVRCRYEIRLGDGSVKTIRAENVRLISRPAKTSPRRHKKEGGTKAADRGK